MAVAAAREGLNCRKCLPAQKVDRGCTKNTVVPGRWQIDGEGYSRCPASLATKMSCELITAYNFYKNGYLPNGRGWRNETNKFIQAMQVIDRAMQKEKENAR